MDQNTAETQEVKGIHQTLQKLIGLHRQLMDAVRMEREALVQADIKGIQEATLAKQALIEGVHQAETERQRQVALLALAWKTPVKELPLSAIIVRIQGYDPKGAEQLRTTLNALSILVQRVVEQNEDNRGFLGRSMEHLGRMKDNVLGESVPKSNTYSASGQRATNAHGARLISSEA